MRLEFDHVNAWTKFIEGDPTTTGRAATANVISHLEWEVPKRLAASLESTMTKLAQFRNDVDAHDFFVLTTDAPTVEMLAYTVVQYFPGLDSAARAVDDSRSPDGPVIPRCRPARRRSVRPRGSSTGPGHQVAHSFVAQFRQPRSAGCSPSSSCPIR